MQTLRKSDSRGKTNIGWLDSRHTFSFGDYRDATQMGFGALRVINEDIVIGGAGFPQHSHSDMEIVTYMLGGTLAHKDSLGSSGIIRQGEIQRMSAGTGITHSEFNASTTDPAHFLQIWIVPSKRGIEPSYEQKIIDPAGMCNKLLRIAAFEPLETEVRLMQDAEIWAARFDGEEEAVHRLQPGRKAWVQVARGNIEIGGERLSSGDAVAISDADTILVRAHGPGEVLLFDLA